MPDPIPADAQGQLDGFYAALGVPVGDFAAAMARLGTMQQAQGNHDALVKALGAQDHAAAITAATNIEATIATGVKQLAASAGLAAPVEKGSTNADPGARQSAVTPRSRLAANIDAQIAS